MPPRIAIPLEEIAARVDIVEVIGEYVPLKPAGKDFVGLCPFHSERTPSFTVSPDKQLFYCFGCQAGGNVYHFLMRFKGLSFREAVEEVGRRAGLSPDALGYSEADRAAWERRQRALAACHAAWEFFRQALEGPLGEAARAYLRARGIDREAVEVFGLGYAPADPSLLEKALKQKGISREAALDAGLLAGAAVKDGPGSPSPGSAASWRCRFRHRLMFPIRDVRGQVVGFGARKLAEQDWGPKYLNSPQSLIFNKRQVLFGLWEARQAVRQSDTALLVEGYTDVIALHMRGIRQAVASLGTSLTEEQARLLKRYCQQVIVAFDADTAGEQATLKGLKTLSTAGLRVRVLTLPRGMDPDEFLARHGQEAFRERMDKALALEEFRLRMALRGQRLDTVDGRARAVAAVLPILAEMESAVEREGYIQRLSDALGVSAQAIWHDLERLRQGALGEALGDAPGGRHRLATNGHNKKGFAPPYGEHKGGSPGPAGTEVHRPAGTAWSSSSGPYTISAGRRTREGLQRPDAVRRAELMVVRRMLEGPEQTMQVLRYLAGARPVDNLLQDVVRHLEVRATRPGMDEDGWREPIGDRRLDACLERLLQMDPPGEDEWQAYADRLVEYRLREQLRLLGGRLQQEAESAEDEIDNAQLERLIELLLEYHELRRQVTEESKRRRSAGAPAHRW